MDIIKPENVEGCISLIGMPGVGKTTVGKALAEKLRWAFMDTDALIESLYARRLQDITDQFGKKAFLRLEAIVVESIAARRCIIATGGSVVYSGKAMTHLRSLGPVVYLQAHLPLVLERIAMNPERGIAIAPGQTIEDLFAERERLYLEYASHVCDVADMRADELVDWILENVKIPELPGESD